MILRTVTTGFGCDQRLHDIFKGKEVQRRYKKIKEGAANYAVRHVQTVMIGELQEDPEPVPSFQGLADCPLIPILQQYYLKAKSCFSVPYG